MLAQIPDPRGRQGRRHCLEAMIASVVCALLQGARGYAAIAQWIHCQPPEFWHLLGYTRKPPRRNAFRKLLLKLPAEQLEQVLRTWMAHYLGQPLPEQPLQAVAIDGKTLRGSLEKNLQPAVHLLSLLDQATGCVLSQTRVDDKTNEAKAALELLKTLLLKGRVVTGDAMFCQREICQQIIDSGGHYLLVVKDNQPTLLESIAAEFRAAFSPGERTCA
jgi:DDE_Tnp_1-associated/Transposase DDE domain